MEALQQCPPVEIKRLFLFSLVQQQLELDGVAPEQVSVEGDPVVALGEQRAFGHGTTHAT